MLPQHPFAYDARIILSHAYAHLIVVHDRVYLLSQACALRFRGAHACYPKGMLALSMIAFACIPRHEPARGLKNLCRYVI